jgi:hypothetical protein
VQQGLETADWLTRREIIRTLVGRVEIDHTQVKVVFRVPPVPFVVSPDSLDRGVLQLCRRRRRAPLWSAVARVPMWRRSGRSPSSRSASASTAPTSRTSC